MTIRIAIGIIALVAGLAIAPVETSARGGGFGGGRAMISHGGMMSHGGFRAPMIRPPAARIPITPFAHLRHRRVVPGVVWGAPWYGYGDYYDPSAVVPEERPRRTADYPDVTGPRPSRGCVTETYEVPSEAGGKVSINVVRC